MKKIYFILGLIAASVILIILVDYFTWNYLAFNKKQKQKRTFPLGALSDEEKPESKKVVSSKLPQAPADGKTNTYVKDDFSEKILWRDERKNLVEVWTKPLGQKEYKIINMRSSN